MVTLYFLKPNRKIVPLRATKAYGEVEVRLGIWKYVVIFMLQQLQGNSLL